MRFRVRVSFRVRVRDHDGLRPGEALYPNP